MTDIDILLDWLKEKRSLCMGAENQKIEMMGSAFHMVIDKINKLWSLTK